MAIEIYAFVSENTKEKLDILRQHFKTTSSPETLVEAINLLHNMLERCGGAFIIKSKEGEIVEYSYK